MTYYYWLESVATYGAATCYGPLEVLVPEDSDDPANPGIQIATQLTGAYPNPFNPSTTISYSLAASAEVAIELYNLRGEKVRGYRRSHPEKGRYSLLWDGRDDQGLACASGVYLCRMSSGSYTAATKLSLLK
jgi:hypothetical protein